MNPTFNLLDEPWIPVVQHDGSSVELSLCDVLLHAHELRSLHGESPLVVAALYRLLLAVLHRVVDGPKNAGHWSELWRIGTWDPLAVNEYLDHWHDRFDLFHPAVPFYQCKADDLRDKKVIDLYPEMASGNNATLFDHNTEGNYASFTPQQAARALLFVQACSFAGGSGLAPKDSSDAPLARGVVFLVEGENLFQSLALNLLPYQNMPERGIENSDQDQPIWESTDGYYPKRKIPLGYMDYLTWPTRRILLHPELINSQVAVRQVSMGAGQRLNRELLGPFHHYRMDKTRGYLVHRLSEYRVLWRDSASFLRLQSPEEVFPPETIRWLAELVSDGELEDHHTYRYMALGMASNQAKVDYFRNQHLPLPGAYLQNQELVSDLKTVLDAAENVRSRLGASLARTASLLLSPTSDHPEGRKPDRKDVNNLLSHWAFDRFYWAALEIPFLELLEALPRERDNALDAWDQVLQQTARQVFDQVECRLGTQPRALRASVRGSGQLQGSLRKLFSPAHTE